LEQLRSKYKIDGQIYRIFPSGEVRPSLALIDRWFLM
jgi:hypothetical protein